MALIADLSQTVYNNGSHTQPKVGVVEIEIALKAITSLNATRIHPPFTSNLLRLLRSTESTCQLSLSTVNCLLELKTLVAVECEKFDAHFFVLRGSPAISSSPLDDLLTTCKRLQRGNFVDRAWVLLWSNLIHHIHLHVTQTPPFTSGELCEEKDAGINMHHTGINMHHNDKNMHYTGIDMQRLRPLNRLWVLFRSVVLAADMGLVLNKLDLIKLKDILMMSVGVDKSDERPEGPCWKATALLIWNVLDDPRYRYIEQENVIERIIDDGAHEQLALLLGVRRFGPPSRYGRYWIKIISNAIKSDNNWCSPQLDNLYAQVLLKNNGQLDQSSLCEIFNLIADCTLQAVPSQSLGVKGVEEMEVRIRKERSRSRQVKWALLSQIKINSIELKSVSLLVQGLVKANMTEHKIFDDALNTLLTLSRLKKKGYDDDQVEEAVRLVALTASPDFLSPKGSELVDELFRINQQLIEGICKKLRGYE
eukprot:GHVN01015620.1.p1 GENE.GHVN01015620.1~~GHVN01015620.1.p1  ORF type:complete len:479 (-),score=85.48 GHVN01015620.1:95-1531(-)